MVFLLFDLHIYLWWWKMVVDCVHKLINQFPLNQMIGRPVDWSIDWFPVWPTAAPPPHSKFLDPPLCAEVRPDHAGEQYVSFAIIVAWKTAVSDVAGSPWLRTGTRIAYNELEHEANSELTWSAAALLLTEEDGKGREGRERRGKEKKKKLHPLKWIRLRI